MDSTGVFYTELQLSESASFLAASCSLIIITTTTTYLSVEQLALKRKLKIIFIGNTGFGHDDVLWPAICSLVRGLRTFHNRLEKQIKSLWTRDKLVVVSIYLLISSR